MVIIYIFGPTSFSKICTNYVILELSVFELKTADLLKDPYRFYSYEIVPQLRRLATVYTV